jgi:AcrR family transcriptional regulator
MRPRTRKRGEARERIVAAATTLFNEVGYGGTDSNAIARAAGYAPATFYRYFTDKLSLFLEVFRRSVQDEWSAIESIAPERGRVRALVRVLLDHHRRWAGLRRSLRGLALTDPDARAAFWARRTEQIDRAIVVSGKADLPLGRARAAAAIIVLAALADAAADGELECYGLGPDEIEQMMVDLALTLAQAPGTAPREDK